MTFRRRRENASVRFYVLLSAGTSFMEFFKRSLKIGGLSFVVLAIVVLAGSLFVCAQTRSFVRSACRAQGVVIRLAGQSSHETGPADYPVCRFSDALGKEHLTSFSGGSHLQPYRLGNKIPVLYLPNHAETAKLDSFFQVWRWPIMLGGFGVLDLIIGLGLFRVLTVIDRAECRLAAAHIPERLPATPTAGSGQFA